MWLKWLPWRYLIRRVARAQGFLDPILVLSHLRRFAQPSEVSVPLELLRAGVVFHARGLLNTGAIQHNLDWVWPYWIERQFDPHDDAFIPRAFSITHVNLSHRNWTALGLPDCEHLPIVDPRGLLTPFWDGWSLDAWIITDDKRELIPSQAHDVRQYLDMDHALSVVTETAAQGLSLYCRADMIVHNEMITCRQRVDASADRDAWLALTLRPYNCEGVSFINEANLEDDGRAWRINGKQRVEFSERVERYQFSNYRYGDVHVQLPKPSERTATHCDVGMASAAALFKLQPNVTRSITLHIPLGTPTPPRRVHPSWPDALAEHARLSVPDAHVQFLYDAALRTLILHTPDDVYAGPYTYKRFWFRDAVYILHAMLCAGLTARATRTLRRFPDRQTHVGYFLSQEGEWDSNGQVLWLMQRHAELTGHPPAPWQAKSIRNGALWITRKRLKDTLGVPHAGLLPAGFSAEHLGPNDYYYWDDFWSIAGLRAAADLLDTLRDADSATQFRTEAERLTAAVEHSLQATATRRDRPGLPASPYRRMDGGAIGSIVLGYPLQLAAPRDPRLLDTVEFLLDKCFVDGGFFQDMIHSGINIYLTLHVAQVLLRAGDARAMELMRNVARFASPTGQWPEAIHPRTRGGCMGDGQHAWAAAEWVMMVRNCFVREEPGRLILASGIPGEWLAAPNRLSFGPAPTPYGDISVNLESNAERIMISWQGAWRTSAPVIEIHLPGAAPVVAASGQTSATLHRGIP
ncbi:MAG: hypothetical protein AB1469_09655 [Pseudomonadota bacterium]